LRAIIGVAK
jgi:hypothetical protein